MDGEHKYMFDEENILYILESNVQLRPFDPSLDMKEREYESIYAEAERSELCFIETREFMATVHTPQAQSHPGMSAFICM
jgi:hypothetical protein